MPHDRFDPNSTLLRPLASYAERFSFLQDGPRYARSTWWRWATRGISGRRLWTVCLGRRRYTCDAAIWAFFNREGEGKDWKPPRVLEWAEDENCGPSPRPDRDGDGLHHSSGSAPSES